MLRIHFTAADLGAVRLAADADPLWESLLSQHLLRGGATPPVLGDWRAAATARLTPQMRALMGLAPPTGYSADFLTPTSGVRDIAAGIDAVLATPLEHLRADLHRLVTRRPSSGWLRRLADGDRRALSALAAVMRSYFDAVLSPHWELIASQVAAARARGARRMVDGGVDRLLTTLHPAVRWEAPTLHVAYPVDRDLHLDGRGLVLMPSFFCRRTPVTLRAADRPPVLVYPIDDELGWAAGPAAAPGDRLLALLGTTRAAVLRTVALHPHGCTTGELAARVRVSLSSASEHATTLRRAGLLWARPCGRHTLHTVTPLGYALLDGASRAER
ncbi:transcriptional regulator [Catellatospora sp. IY07-71]|uniref:ArsR/SmtB family transcription factor n=1 Tax=Catellatospora sp. IY07-71 TaxID=2728827 RepID=UPI001BB3A0CE|nr:winged helix-turn-helix domain-containing protein [Catellatospora sp. IY07-71]BCJ75408.1 transcriptional regulator [Catellatospora sp. IY07-71]